MKKLTKILSLLLAVMLMLGCLAACKDNDTGTDTSSEVIADVTPEPDPVTDVGSATEEDSVGGPIEGVETVEEYLLSNEDAYFTFGEKTINLPCKFSDFEAAGFKVVEEPETTELKSKTHGSLSVTNDEEGVSILVTLYNSADKDRDYKECDVYAIMVDTYESNNTSAIKLGKIDWTDTADSLMEKLGQPTETYAGYGSDMYTWADAAKTKGMDVAFDQESGKMYSASLVNYTWEVELPAESEVESGTESNVELGADSSASSES